MKKTFETIARFTYPSEAHVMKGRLESEGIPAFIVDHGTMDSDPLISKITGGAKLNVYVEDKERAMEILNSISDFSLNDGGEALVCPKCGSKKVKFFSNAMHILSSIFSWFGFSAKYRYDYRCSDCKHKFLLE